MVGQYVRLRPVSVLCCTIDISQYRTRALVAIYGSGTRRTWGRKGLSWSLPSSTIQFPPPPPIILPGGGNNNIHFQRLLHARPDGGIEDHLSTYLTQAPVFRSRAILPSCDTRCWRAELGMRHADLLREATAVIPKLALALCIILLYLVWVCGRVAVCVCVWWWHE